MFNLIKKDFLSLSKSKSDLIELLLMPLILIVILGFTLGDILMGDFNVSTFNVGVVNNQNFAADLNRLEDDLLEEGMSEEAVGELIASTKETDPASMLIDLLTGEEFKDLMVVQGFEDAQSAQKMMEEDELAGYITIPEEFSYEVWQSIYSDEDPSATLEVAGQGE
ncbi:MAG: hypothetical protein L0L10_12155, partial [Tetragenococcus sp.]|nr:hypothetical protein [Tetragenococcus sp.]MDN6700217.1 hypothetical protein [Tetragenococcus koreensis]